TQSYLRCRKPYALGVIHRFEHIVAERSEFFVKVLDRLTCPAKNSLRIFGYLSYRHQCKKEAHSERCYYLGITPRLAPRRKSLFAKNPFSSRARHSQQIFLS